MQRVVVALLIALTITLAFVGVVVWQAEQRRARDHDELICFERLHVLAAVAVMVPESRVDVDARIEAVKSLGSDFANC